MKIIKPGREQRGWAAEVECTGAGNGSGGCGALLLVETRDLFRTYHHARDETDMYTTFRCCACGVRTDLDRKHRPPGEEIAENEAAQEAAMKEGT